MPQWFSVLVGVLSGLVVVAAAIFVAVRPNLRPKRSKSFFPDASDNKDSMAGWTGWSAWFVDGHDGSIEGGAGDGGSSGGGSAH
jgi:hypothetical protein